MHESGFQLNNRPTQVLAAKGSKNVASLTSGERAETISVIACCNAEGMFLPPYSIFKGKNRKAEFLDGMPPGSQISMSEKSAYVNAIILKDWLEFHVLPRNPAGKVLFIVDGHTSHTNSVEVLEFSEANDIILFCLPSHTTHYLQPLDRSFFKSLKNYYYAACTNFLKANPSRKITRIIFGTSLG
ncbi:DDE superfamily endonuclease [Popillia japonica]|uniref:DDE superfamily endonuclease n=1 Tax=Popillia japonica TaxID=7064 RepID=A0AAW1LWB8_POPJA